MTRQPFALRAGRRDAGGHVVYDEEAFRYFLAMERLRSAGSPRSFVLVVISMRQGLELGRTWPSDIAAAVFQVLLNAVRDVDVIGWYRQGRMAGAVLVQRTQAGDELVARVTARLAAQYESALPAHVRAKLRIRAFPTGTRRGGR